MAVDQSQLEIEILSLRVENLDLLRKNRAFRTEIRELNTENSNLRKRNAQLENKWNALVTTMIPFLANETAVFTQSASNVIDCANVAEMGGSDDSNASDNWSTLCVTERDAEDQSDSSDGTIDTYPFADAADDVNESFVNVSNHECAIDVTNGNTTDFISDAAVIEDEESVIEEKNGSSNNAQAEMVMEHNVPIDGNAEQRQEDNTMNANSTAGMVIGGTDNPTENSVSEQVETLRYVGGEENESNDTDESEIIDTNRAAGHQTSTHALPAVGCSTKNRASKQEYGILLRVRKPGGKCRFCIQSGDHLCHETTNHTLAHGKMASSTGDHTISTNGKIELTRKAPRTRAGSQMRPSKGNVASSVERGEGNGNKLDAPKKPHVCRKRGCGKKFWLKEYLTQHTRTHNKARPNKCQVCDKAFILSHHLRQHMLIHTGELPFQCDVPSCLKRFPQKNKLKRHQLVHSGVKPFKCPHPGCGEVFSRRSSLTRHRVINNH